METEIWKDVEGYKGIYQISDQGRVKSLSRKIYRSDGREYCIKERMLKLHKRCDYFFVNLQNNCNIEVVSLHRLVAQHFLPAPDAENIYVNHLNGDKEDNRAINLQWCTPSENVHHFMEELGGKEKLKRGTDHRDSVFTEDQVQWIRDNYTPRHPSYGARALARLFGVSHSSILKIVNNKSPTLVMKGEITT